MRLTYGGMPASWVVREQLLELEAAAEQAELLDGYPDKVRVVVGGRAVVLAWPGERIVVWADTRTPYSSTPNPRTTNSTGHGTRRGLH